MAHAWLIAITREHGVQSIGPIAVPSHEKSVELANDLKVELADSGFDQPKVWEITTQACSASGGR